MINMTCWISLKKKRKEKKRKHHGTDRSKTIRGLAECQSFVFRRDRCINAKYSVFAHWKYQADEILPQSVKYSKDRSSRPCIRPVHMSCIADSLRECVRFLGFWPWKVSQAPAKRVKSLTERRQVVLVWKSGPSRSSSSPFMIEGTAAHE